MKVITEITDDMFGIKPISFNNPKIRYGARGIVKKQDGTIAIFFKKAKNEFKLPGGGIEQEENAREAFMREVLEEVGCEVNNILLLGITKELKSQENFQQISYVFNCNVKKDLKRVEMTQKEMDEGGSVIWLTPEEALEKIIECESQLKASDYDSIYRTKFMNFRDREILKYYIENS